MDELERLDLTPYFNGNSETINLQAFVKSNPSFRASCSKALDMFLGDIVVETSDDLLQIKGGKQLLIDRLVQSIKDSLCWRKVSAPTTHNGTRCTYLNISI